MTGKRVDILPKRTVHKRMAGHEAWVVTGVPCDKWLKTWGLILVQAPIRVCVCAIAHECVVDSWWFSDQSDLQNLNTNKKDFRDNLDTFTCGDS